MLNTVVPILEQHKGMAVVSSRVVAEQLDKEHSKIIRTLEKILEKPNMASLIIPSNYSIEGQNRTYKEYLLTKDGFILYMFNIQGHNDFKMAYINCFNEMEKVIHKQLPTTSTELFKLALGSIEETNARIEEVAGDLQVFKEDMPLLGIEESKVTVAVRKKGVNCLGGKESNAYQDKSVRGKVYADIYRELKRQFGVGSYKAIKRNQVEIAIQIINEYTLPLMLDEQINIINSQGYLHYE